MTFIIILILFSYVSSAKVWQHQNRWDTTWENKYSEWFFSKKVRKDLFISTKSPYYGMLVDCADVAYVMRAIFSYENQLPFAVVNPSSARRNPDSRKNYRVISNLTSRFDHIKDAGERFIGFINYLGTVLDSKTLKDNDTYPVALDKIKPGDIFHFVETHKETPVRHTLLIKNIDSSGNFDLIYSTQSIKKNNEQYFIARKENGNKPLKDFYPRLLMYKKKQAIYHKPNNESGGFRRFIWPRYLRTEANNYPPEFNYSREQFLLAAKTTRKEFFQHIKTLHKTQTDVPNNILNHQLVNICKRARDRVRQVNEALTFLSNEKNNSCMNFNEFDTYSTPARDMELKLAFEDLIDTWSQFENKKQTQEVYTVYKKIITSIINNNDNQTVKQFCPIHYKEKTVISLSDLYARIKNGQMSSDPHDTVAARWGETTINQTKCKVYYN